MNSYDTGTLCHSQAGGLQEHGEGKSDFFFLLFSEFLSYIH